MALLHSISGIRGTIGGYPGEGLSPVDVMTFAGAYGMWLRSNYGEEKRLKVVIGRDARISGPLISNLVASVLQAMGIDVIDARLATTPTIEMGVIDHKAHGGVIITASHNPENWNALKLLNAKGEFMTGEEGEEMRSLMNKSHFKFESSRRLGGYVVDDTLLDNHIKKILELPLVDADAIAGCGFRVVADGINSVGGIAVPRLLNALGVRDIVEVFCEPDGLFQHDPEPLPGHLGHLSATVVKENADAGLAVDPDVDRLAIICEDGEAFGEEYTLVSVADYVLSKTPGNTVSNLSSTQALAEVTAKHGGQHFYSAVGEAHVVAAMKKHQAVIGGEGNGGIIYPALHYGRDALAGIALFLTSLARQGVSCSKLKKQFPLYHLSKNKIDLPSGIDIPGVIDRVRSKYNNQSTDLTDGLKIWFDREWVHLRPSNTEPVIRIYAEGGDAAAADRIAGKLKDDIREVLRSL